MLARLGTVMASGWGLRLLGSQTTAADRERIDRHSVSSHLLAVTASGTGTVVPVTVETGPGEGGLFVDIANVTPRASMETALRDAVAYARRTGGYSLDRREITVSFDVKSDAVTDLSGTSGEAALTAAVVAALRGQQLDAETLVTGSVSNGSIERVGGIRPKARAARRFGANQLLVPPGQAVDAPGINITVARRMQEVLDVLLGN
jgi:predicted S18 family serine protease